MDKTDFKYMKRALSLSLKGMGFVNPNPLVGAVIVKGGKIIGEGYHKKYGGAHAEINALNNCKDSPHGATMYVTLEPCSHHGKTPPCVDAIIKSGIAKVVCAMKDPNPKVCGAGLKKLKDAGIEVVCDVLRDEAVAINEVFIKYISTQMPFVVVKSAVTLDGKIATRVGDSKWITNEKSRKIVHKLRHRYSAIMVGVNTVLRDDPLLTARVRTGSGSCQGDSPPTGGGNKNPVRIVLDPTLRTPLNAKLLDDSAQTIIVTGENYDNERYTELTNLGVSVLVIPLRDGIIPLDVVMKELGERGIDSVLIEGGGTLNGCAFEAGIVDKVVVFIAPKLVGGKDAPTLFEAHGVEKMSQASELILVGRKEIDGDIMLEYLVKNKG